MKLIYEWFFSCEEELKYCYRFSSFEEFWNACDRGERMLRLAKKLEVDDRVLTRAKALCANTVRCLMTDERSTGAVDAALRYADGKISRKELDKYAADAIDAYNAVNNSPSCTYAGKEIRCALRAYTCAASAACWAACDSVNAAQPALSADTALCWAARAADCFHDDSNRLQTANICREVLTEAVFEKARQFNDNLRKSICMLQKLSKEQKKVMLELHSKNMSFCNGKKNTNFAAWQQ